MYSFLDNQAYNTTNQCCDGYYCCNTCCSICKSCSGNKCTSYQCNCYCCQSVSNRACSHSTYSCWKAAANFEYQVDSKTYKSAVIQDCSSQYGCVDDFHRQYSTGATYSCYYDPNDPKTMSLTT